MGKTKLPPFHWIHVVPIVVALIGGIFIGMNLPRADAPAEAESTQQAEQEPQAPEARAAQEQTELPDLARKLENDPTAIGDADAPVVIAVYSDYMCRFCVKWANETLPVLEREYIDQGKVRLEYRDLNFFGEGSQQAALGAYAAGLQGKFKEFSDYVFEPGTVRPANELTAEALVEVAGDLGMDAEQFEKDMASEKVAKAVAEQQEEATMLGITSTPAFVVNKRPILGAQPTEVFTKTIEAELESLNE
ncbi:DsbA family protein [Micrococcoides hystricis]|uniref:DsbA family protein n=1 Tax=Micrococcoides hystricis TaxID=1572761 RepID=A0ABV6PCQ9_9MICC